MAVAIFERALDHNNARVLSVRGTIIRRVEYEQTDCGRDASLATQVSDTRTDLVQRARLHSLVRPGRLLRD
jgi:hypothetical protein